LDICKFFLVYVLAVGEVGQAIDVGAGVYCYGVPVHVVELLKHSEDLWHDLQLKLPGLAASLATGDVRDS